MPAVAEQTGTESQYGLSAITRPAHASLFYTLMDQGFGSGFDGAAADGEAGLSIGSIVHASSVFPQIGDRLVDFWRRVCGVGIETQDALDNRLVVLLTSSASKATRNLPAAVCRRRFLIIELVLHVLGDLLHCRVGSKRVAFGHYSYSPPPNRACNFHRTRLSSVSFHLSFFPDDVKDRFDLLHYACLSVFVSDTPASLRHVRGFPSLRLLWRLRCPMSLGT